ncbi:MAG: GntR family transcriptional regulator [Acidobacteriota bacterium]
MQNPILDSPNLAQRAALHLRELIVTGEIGPQERLHEIDLAERLGISRTPVREALASLVGEGFLEQKPRRGVFVRPLEIAEFEQVYQIRNLLDPGALEAGGIPSNERIELLERLNEQIRIEAHDPERVIDLDDRFHLLLVEHCNNEVLLDLIGQFMARTRRYEWAYMREIGHVGVATDEHDQILDALKQSNLSGACAALRQNMTSGRAPLRAWLKARETTNV